jgi:hypothetical protein
MTVAELAQSSRAWLLRRELDRRIARGADPASSPELSRRARQLVSPGFRARMAAGLRRTIAAAEQPWPSRLSARVRFNAAPFSMSVNGCWASRGP